MLTMIGMLCLIRGGAECYCENVERSILKVLIIIRGMGIDREAKMGAWILDGRVGFALSGYFGVLGLLRFDVIVE